MGQPTAPARMKLLVGLLAGRTQWLAAAEERLARRFGPVDLASQLFPFEVTDYYAAEMGPGLLRKFVAIEPLVCPGELAAIKLATNALEGELARDLAAPVPRPVNLDPGLLGPSKLILATTKDYSHRIYLRDGIYAEITLIWRNGAWLPTPWTYRDYRSEAYHAFFTQMRARLMAQRRQGKDSRSARNR